MARLKIDDIRQQFESEGWELLSTEYKNLDTPLEAKCPEGHRNSVPFKKWRARRNCSVCIEKGDIAAPVKDVPKKKSGVIRVLALDDATDTTGWALFDDEELVGYGAIRMGHDNAIARIAALRQWLLSALDLWKPDKVAIEDIQLQTYYNQKSKKMEGNVKLYKTLAHLQGVLLTTLWEQKIDNVVVHVSTWRSHCGITARSRDDQKRAAQLKVSEWYTLNLSHDVAEAICMGKYVSEKYIRNNSIISWG